MSRQSRGLFLHVSRQGLVLWSKDDARATELGRQMFESSSAGPAPTSASQLTTGVTLLISTHSAAFARQPVQVIADSVYCPGLSIDLGENILPSRVRKAFIRTRFRAVSADSGDWEIQTDSDRITGRVLSFAMERSTRELLENALAEVRVRSTSIQPTWVWCWQQRPAVKLTGLFISGSEFETTLVYMHQGRPLTFESMPRPIEDCNGQQELSRQMLLHGVLDESRDVRIVGLPRSKVA